MRDRVALVSGGSRGIGCDTADLSLTGDVRNEGEVAEAVGRVREELGPVSILVNSAGVSVEGLIPSISLECWNYVLAVNLTGAFLLMRAVLPDMLAAGWGRVVNISSVLGKTGAVYQGAYAASKHGLLGLTRASALEVADKGVTVNAVCPGVVDTDMTVEVSERLARLADTRVETVRRIAIAANPQRRLHLPAEVAAIVRFLCSEEAAGVNGQALNHCGGRNFA